MTNPGHPGSTPIPPRANELIAELITTVGGDPDSFEGQLIGQMVKAGVKLIGDGADTGQLKLITAAVKEMRYAYRVFSRYRGVRKVSIFGSARTPPEHPDYEAAREFGKSIANNGWMVITGAGDGIMKAGHEGPRRRASFGLSIRLPFETTANEVIEGDPKLINFRYFFTRKLMFLSHSDAIVVFPGGFGTQDELFESLTLVQTGRNNMIPIVLVEGAGGSYWLHWENYVRHNLRDTGWISPEDRNIFHIAGSVDEAVDHVMRFYRRYHSSRYVGDRFVLRLNQPLADAQVRQLGDEFDHLVASGRIEQCGALEGEEDHLELPRLAFHHTRRAYGNVRALIDRVNGFE